MILSHRATRRIFSDYDDFFSEEGMGRHVGRGVGKSKGIFHCLHDGVRGRSDKGTVQIDNGPNAVDAGADWPTQGTAYYVSINICIFGLGRFFV